MTFLEDWPLDRLRGLHRVAKRTGFFRDPRTMKHLRELIARKEASRAQET